MNNIKIAFSDEYVLHLPVEHKFPILKYKLIPEILLNEGTISEGNIFAPGLIDISILKLTHTDHYISKLINLQLSEKEVRKIGFPQSKELIEREFIITNGTVKGALHALKYGCAFNVAGGTHHAYASSGEGFCLFNDCAVAANYLLNRKYVNKIMIIDLDVHQGNGTAKIFSDESRVFTFSMHGKDNYPLHKEKSDLDIPLKQGITDQQYLAILDDVLPQLIKSFKPEFLFYISGVDVLNTDKWGKMALTKNGCMERDEYIFKLAMNNGLPIMTAMGGGYSPNLDDIVEAHCNTFRIAFEIFG